MIKVSIIMPIYNTSKFLERSCASVEKQTLKDVELICVDASSTDDMLYLLNKLKEKHDFIKIFALKNKGLEKARNFGMSEAQGEYLAFLDPSDVFLDDDALEKMYFYGSENDANIICSNLKILQKDNIEQNHDFKNTKFTYFNKKDIVLPIEYGIPSAFCKNIFKREFIEKYNIMFPDLIIGQTPVFLAKALVNTNKLYVLRTDLYGYNQDKSDDINIEANTFEKKLDYVKHFKLTFDLLKENLFEESYAAYKREFIDYLLFQNNLYNEDIRNAVREVFSENIGKYYAEEDYGYSYIDMIINDNLDVNSYDSFGELKGDLIKESLLNNNLIEVDQLREYVKILNENKDNKHLLEKVSINKVKEIEKEVNDDYEFLSENIELINDEFNLIFAKNKAKLAEENDFVRKEIKNDANNANNSMINKFLKTIKHFYRG